MRATIQLILTSLLACALPFQSQAGNEKGNGGTGIRLSGKLYLTDFVEAGVENDPYVNRAADCPEIREALGTKLSQLGSGASLVAAKLCEIQRISPGIGAALTYSLKSLTFRFVDPDLTPIDDLSTPLVIGKRQVVQLAVRQGTTVFINRNRLAELNFAHRAGLVLHELLYAWAPVVYRSVQERDPRKTMSWVTRELVGQLFSASFATWTRGELLQYLTQYQWIDLRSADRIKDPVVRASNRYAAELVARDEVCVVFSANGAVEQSACFVWDTSDQDMRSELRGLCERLEKSYEPLLATYVSSSLSTRIESGQRIVYADRFRIVPITGHAPHPALGFTVGQCADDISRFIQSLNPSENVN